MNLLITGHKGFIGQNMMRYMADAGHNVIGFEWTDSDYNLHDIDRVIHLGAISSTTFSDTATLLRQNYFFTVDLIKRCSWYGIPLQIASSASVYGTDNTTFNELDTPAPKNHYAWSKLLVEQYCASRNFSVPVQLFRYFNVYGPGEEHKGDQASPFHKFTKSAIENSVIKIFKGSDQYKRDFIHVDEVVRYHERFFNVDVGGLWNIGTGTSTSFHEVAKGIARRYNAVIEHIPMPDNLKQSYQAFTQADMTRTLTTLKYYER